MAIETNPVEGDPTLHLPRILCLHGGGTNARIFRMQCRVLERSLRSDFRLVYAEAPFPALPGSDVTSVYKNYGPFKSWLRMIPSDPERSPQEVLDQINVSLATAMYRDTMQGATGEWVALLGFSQGAKVAASILYAQQTLRARQGGHAKIRPDLRFAILIAGRGPLVWMLPGSDMPMPSGLVDAAHPSAITDSPSLPWDSTGHILKVPTIHVHGLRDPGLDLHRKFRNNYCDIDATSVVEWDGVHRVPIKTKDVKAVVGQICSIARETGVLNIWGGSAMFFP